jgi:hypothetical protein
MAKPKSVKIVGFNYYFVELSFIRYSPHQTNSKVYLKQVIMKYINKIFNQKKRRKINSILSGTINNNKIEDKISNEKSCLFDYTQNSIDIRCSTSNNMNAKLAKSQHNCHVRSCQKQRRSLQNRTNELVPNKNTVNLQSCNDCDYPVHVKRSMDGEEWILNKSHKKQSTISNNSQTKQTQLSLTHYINNNRGHFKAPPNVTISPM